VSNEFILSRSNAHEKTIDILEKHCSDFEGYNPELIEFVKSDDVLNEVVDSIQEGLDSLGDRVSFNLSTSDFDVDFEITVFNLQGKMFMSGVTNPEFSRLVKLYIFAQDLSIEEDYNICDDVYYRIDMLR
jgi:hypothetical protein